MKTLLVTGGAGFIGSNFVHYMMKRYDVRIVNLDALTYAGNLDNVSDIQESERYHFIKGDIGDKILVKQLFEQYHIDIVVNFAAESHVDRSIEQPDLFLRTNILGTQVLLDTAKTYWNLHGDDK